MKIVAVLENSITAGGGFNQALSAILQMREICSGRFEFEVFTTQPDNVAYLAKLGITSVSFSFSLIDKLLAKLSTNAWWQAIQNRARIVGPFEKKLVAHGCNLVYFVTPSGISASLQRLNYIATVWDTCHRDTPEFPEVRDFNQFLIRERYYQNSLAPAFVTIVDSVQLADSIARRYGVDRDRLLPMPFSPSPLMDGTLSKSKGEVLGKYKLQEGYFFYPAQFWAHKNHIRILEALLLLNETGQHYRVVFAGGDQGTRAYVESFVDRNGLVDQVRFLGFVPAEDMRVLYEGCLAVVMPTYFGPTNIPPLEAWMMGKPLLYTAQFAEQVGDAAILVDPDEAADLAAAMTKCMDKELREQLVQLGQSRVHAINEQRKVAVVELLARLDSFERRLQCWGGDGYRA